MQRDAERGEKVIAEVLDMVRGTKLDTGTYPDEIDWPALWAGGLGFAPASAVSLSSPPPRENGIVISSQIHDHCAGDFSRKDWGRNGNGRARSAPVMV